MSTTTLSLTKDEKVQLLRILYAKYKGKEFYVSDLFGSISYTLYNHPIRYTGKTKDAITPEQKELVYTIGDSMYKANLIEKRSFISKRDKQVILLKFTKNILRWV